MIGSTKPSGYYDKLLLVLSSTRMNSEWVEDEVYDGFEEERRRRKHRCCFRAARDRLHADTDKPWAARCAGRHIADFSNWKDHDAYKKAFDRLLRDLKANDRQAASRRTELERLHDDS